MESSTSTSVPVLTIKVRDAETREFVAEGAVGTIVDGGFSAMLMEVPPENGGEIEALGFYTVRDGEYVVTIERNGYETWKREVLPLVANECFVEPPRAMIDAELTRSSK